jgi:two-component system LytT family response regulator
VKSQEDRIAVPTGEGLEFLSIRQISRIESSSNYSRLFFSDGRTLVVTRLLKDFESLLGPYDFYRVHHSHLVNLKHIRKYIRGEGGQVVMLNGDVIDVARRKKEEFLKLLGY